MNDLVNLIKFCTKEGISIEFEKGNGIIGINYTDEINDIHIETSWDGSMLIDTKHEVDTKKLILAIYRYNEIRKELGEA